MTIDHSRVRLRHFCELPEIVSYEFPNPPHDPVTKWLLAPVIVVHHPEGTRLTCDVCMLRWTVWRRPDQRGRHFFRVGGLEWVASSPLAAAWRRARRARSDCA